MSAHRRLPALASVLLLAIFTVAAGADLCEIDNRPLAGLVVDAAGEPAAGAEVWLVTASLSGDAEVYDQAKAAADGTFRLTVPGRWSDNVVAYRQELGVVAFKPGGATAVVGFSRISPLPDTGLRIQLPSAFPAPLRIVAPDGKPASGAQVSVAALQCDAIRNDLRPDPNPDSGTQTYLTDDMRAALKTTPNGPALGRVTILLPPDLSRRLRSEADKSGKVVLPGVSFEDVAALRIETEGFGTQVAQLNARPNDYGPKPKMPETISLVPVGSLTGRLAAPRAGNSTKAAIKIRSFLRLGEQVPPRELTIYGLAEVTADEQGKFAVPAMAAGTLDVFVSLAKEPPLDARPPMNSVVEAGKATMLEIPLVPAVSASGVVREHGTKRPIEGLVVYILHGANRPEVAVTDREGRYACFVSSGQVLAMPLVPSSYAPLAAQQQRTMLKTVRESETAAQFAPIELTPLRVVRGFVVDDAGRAVANVLVHASWLGTDRNRNQPSLVRRHTTSGDKGEFIVAGVDPQHELLIEARTPTAFGRQRIAAQDKADEPITLTVRGDNLVALSGRVVDTSGRPASGLPVEIWTYPQLPEGATGAFTRVEFDADAGLRTDADGRYRTPRELDRESVYQARIALPGREPAAAPALCVSEHNNSQFDDLVVRRVTTIAGRVLDSEGRPVPAATVFQAGDLWRRVQATSDAHGRFRLEGAMADPTFVFATKAGFRFFGQLLDGTKGENSVELALTRNDEAAAAWKTLPAALAKDKRTALALRVLQPSLDKLDKEKPDYAAQILAAYARVDPAGLLTRLEKQPPQDTFLSSSLRHEAALAMAGDDVDEALAVIETIEDASLRSMSYCDVVDLLGGGERARKLELLEEAALSARRSAIPPCAWRCWARPPSGCLTWAQRTRPSCFCARGKRLPTSFL